MSCSMNQPVKLTCFAGLVCVEAKVLYQAKQRSSLQAGLHLFHTIG
jgi:hypothetical protein